MDFQQKPARFPPTAEKNHPPVIALGARLKASQVVKTLGFKPNFCDYTVMEIDLIHRAETIYWPTAFYAGLFNAMGKKIFPSLSNYNFALDKIKQTTMFKLLGIPHPRTKLFFGRNQKKGITDFFSFPFIAKIARGSSRGRGVFFIKSQNDLNSYLKIPGPAYIQEYIPNHRDMRIIVIGREIVLAFWRKAANNEFRTNLSQGGKISFSKLPNQALNLALETAKRCNWDDVGLDIMEHKGKPMVIEANMKYGTKGFKAAGIDYRGLLEHLILTGKI